MRGWWMWLLLASACRLDDPGLGTAVGNPGAGLTVETPAGSDVTTIAGNVEGLLEALSCDGTTRALAPQGTVDLTGAAAYIVPEGTWCGVRLTTSAPLAYTGTLSDGRAFDVKVDVGTLEASATTGFASVDGAWVLQVGPDGWLAGTLDAADPLVVAPGAAGHDAVAADVVAGTLLFDDANGDGLRGGGEPILAGASDDDDDDDDDDDTDEDTDEDSDDDTDE